MNHDETRKALECCMNRQCSKCPFYGMQPLCIEKLHYRLEDLLIANDKKMEKLKKECADLEDSKNAYHDLVNTCEVGAVKMFADMLQERCNSQEGCLYASDIGAVLNEWESEHK